MNRKITAVVTSTLALLLVSGCSGTSEGRDRARLQKTTTLAESLEKKNLEAKLERENNPNAVRYVYLISFAKPFGYYVIKGKVSSSGSQLAPEEEAIRFCSGCERLVMDSAQDDGTYGSGDPGIFFFLADGTMVSTTLDYIESDQPLPIQVPLLGD